MDKTKKYVVIACEILSRELFYCASKSENIIDLHFLPKGLHDVGADGMKKRIQEEIDRVDQEKDKYDAVLLSFGLCNNGIIGLKSKLPLVICKAHDCITLLLGSKESYTTYFDNNPGTFFKSPGWLERDVSPNETGGSITQKLGLYIDYSQYDEETAAFLKESIGDWMHNYKKIAYIDTGVGNPDQYIEMAKEQAQEKSFDFELVPGNLKLLQDLLNGTWDERYLVITPGHKILNTYDSNIVKSGSGAE